MTPAERIQALQTEFERLKEHADHLNRMLQGREDAWADIRVMIPNGTELVIDKLVGEARQNAAAMATIAKTLAALGDAEEKAPEVDPLADIQKRQKDELAERREAKNA